MKHVDIDSFVRGDAQYVDDVPLPEGSLHGAVFGSSLAHGTIKNLDVSAAEKYPGVRAVLKAKDVTGQNQIGYILPDEPFFAFEEVKYIGEPIALVVAETEEAARKASTLIQCEIEELPALYDPREAYAKNLISGGTETYLLGDPDGAWAKCDIVVEGKMETGEQEHFYFETQRAFSVPTDNGGVRIASSTQSTSGVQHSVARILGIPMNKVEVDTLRIGGGFGGKEAQAAKWAAMTALAAIKLNRPVKLVLSRDEDMKMSGKRHGYSFDYKIGLSKDGKILAYEVFHYQNAGAYSDIALPVLHKGVAHSTSAYFVPNVKATGAACLTNVVPSTAFRGFGYPQAAMAIETALYRAAKKLGIPYHELQKKNLFSENDETLFGQKLKNCLAHATFDETVKKYDFEKILSDISAWNDSHTLLKKGVAIFPLAFGVSFDGSTFLDQASATVHIYTDGSVSVSTAAVEMGQGVNTKIRGVVAKMFSLEPALIKVESTNTTRIANASATAASSGADLNGNAAIIACDNILSRLRLFAAGKMECKPEEVTFKDGKVFVRGNGTDWDWKRLIWETYVGKISLSAHAFYATPGIFADPKTKRGDLYAYYVYGASIAEVTVDTLRGTYTIDSVKIIHDVGKSLAPEIDMGQVEGAVVQGVGWLTSEEVGYGKDGKLLSGNMGTYKLPDIHSAPEIITEFFAGSENRVGPFNSKAIGEPPLLYGIAAYFALLNAVQAKKGTLEELPQAPLTPEKIFMSLNA